MNCPCHSGKTYDDCCKPYHNGKAPPTALALMRSRYSAYALSLTEYIIETTHPKSVYFEKDRVKWAEAILQFARETRFVGLEILAYGETWVHFHARLMKNKSPFSLKEKSHFEKVDGKWLYLSGEVEIS